MGFPRRFTEASRKAAIWTATPAGLAWLFLAGLIVRLVLATGGGFPYDMGTFAAWADRLAQHGPRRFYDDPDLFADYPPGYLYVLYVLGRLSQALTGSPPSPFLLKLPGIAADLGLALVVVRLTSRLTPASRPMPWEGVAAAAILLNPAVIMVSAVWGQVDSVQAVLVAGAFLVLGTGPASLRREAGGLALLVVALLTKPQAGFVIPVAVLLLVWRHMRPRDHAARGLRIQWSGLARIAGLGLASLALVALLGLPFGKGPVGLVRFYLEASGTYPYTSVWAFNVWGFFGFWRPDLGADDTFRLLGIPAFYVGLAAFVAISAGLVVKAWRYLGAGHVEGRMLMFGAVAFTCLPFAVLTRIHERYMFLALACLAPLVAYRQLRLALVVLSALYYLNVYFPYVFYVEYAGLETVKVEWLFDLVYGTVQDSAQKKVLSLATAGACLTVAWRGWRWLAAPAADEDVPARPYAAEDRPAPARARHGGPWTLSLHPVGVRGAVLAVAALILVAATRLLGISTPPGMYFDEVYHARTGGEYLEGKPVYEWTHPPLPKQVMALSIRAFSGFRTEGPATGPGTTVVAGSPDGLVWADATGPESGQAGHVPLASECAAPRRDGVAVDVAPAAVASAPDGLVVAGLGPRGPAVAHIGDTGDPTWTARLPAPPVRVATVGDTVFVLTSEGQLVLVEPGNVAGVVRGVAAMTPSDDRVWVSLPDRRRVISYGADGAIREEVPVHGLPGTLIAVPEAGRLLVADQAGRSIEAIDIQAGARTDSLDGIAAELLAVPEGTGLVWAAAGRRVSVIEPRGMTELGHVELSSPPDALIADDDGRRVFAVTDQGVECASGRPQAAWRLGSALFGAVMAAAAALIALRLFGSLLTAGLTAAFMAVDGLAFVLARIAMNDSYVTGFVLAGWFCLLSALYNWGLGPQERRLRLPALGWLAAFGLVMGAAISSKWVAIYALAGMGLVVLYDMWSRGRDSLAGILGHPVVTLPVLGGVLAALSLGVYLLSYVPYLRLGHSFGDLVELQQAMYGYHAHLQADHPYGSSWFGWPFGHRPVFLYMDVVNQSQAEIWTIANPVILFGGIIGLAALSVAAWRRRSVALALVPLAAAVQYLPWLAVGRVTFLYHYLPVIPFLATGLAWWIVVGRKGAPRRQRILETGAVVGAAVALFIVLLPLIDGWYVSESYLRTVKSWLGWMF